ncbi:hypothetical protein HK096_010358, partial [Nowakowskiella sp. JEL0078]
VYFLFWTFICLLCTDVFADSYFQGAFNYFYFNTSLPSESFQNNNTTSIPGYVAILNNASLFNGNAILVDFSTGCSIPTLANIPSNHPILALVNLQDSLIIAGCSIYASRLYNSLNSSSFIIAAVVNLPSDYITSKARDIGLLKSEIANSIIPLLQVENYVYAQLVMKTLNTIGASNNNLNTSIALVVNVTSNAPPKSNSNSSQDTFFATFQYQFYALAFAVFVLVPLVFYIQRRQRKIFLRSIAEQSEIRRLERDRLELETFRRTGAVVDEEELSQLEIKKITDLGLEKVVHDEATQSSNLEIHGEKVVGIRRLFQKSPVLKSSEPFELSSVTTTTSCSICLEFMLESDSYRQLHCSHLFHVDCIDMWLLKRSRYCPLCRIDVVRGIHEDDEDKDEETDATQVEPNSDAAILHVDSEESIRV